MKYFGTDDSIELTENCKKQDEVLQSVINIILLLFISKFNKIIHFKTSKPSNP